MLPRLSVNVFQLLKENEELRLLARSVMNETVDLRTGIQTAKSVNKQLHRENQVHSLPGCCTTLPVAAAHSVCSDNSGCLATDG